MSELFRLRKIIEEAIEEKRLEKFYTMGKIALETGLLIPDITEGTIDTPETIQSLKVAIKKVLNISV